VPTLKDKYIILKYLRISSDDGTDTESGSIKNQRDLLDMHIKKTFSNSEYQVIELIDDGFTGTNMNRPGMKKLLVLAETQGINCIIVKDFSRFARDYITVGMYMEQKFPEWGIRFISVNDNYDSIDYRGITSGIETAIKNVAYAMYSKDLSEKIKSARRTRYKKGEFLSPFAFYGYIKDPNNKNHIIIDEEAANVVRRIFKMKTSGMSNAQIAIWLNKQSVLTPSMYKKSKDPLCRNWNNVSGFYLWSASIVGNILNNERYTGKMINGKMERTAVGSTKVRRAKKEDIIVVENTHEPIISQEIFDSVRQINKKSGKPKTSKFSLGSILKCGGCKHTLDKYGSKHQTVKYFCSYKRYIEQNDCFEGKILEAEICNLLSRIIKQEIAKSVESETVENQVNKKTQDDIKVIEDFQKEIGLLKKERLKEYMRLSKDEIPESQFEQNRDSINQQIENIESSIKMLQTKAITQKELTFNSALQRYVGIEELNRDIVDDLIKEIYIYPDSRLEIVWKFSDNSKKYM
jgi:DNA invertase Pin-like site-specific DNA recombinase